MRIILQYDKISSITYLEGLMASLVDEMKKEGIPLENKVCKILNERGYTAEKNPFEKENSEMDIDVFAVPYLRPSSSILVIQCKGAGPEMILSLNGDTDASIRKDPSMYEGIWYRNLELLTYAQEGLKYEAPVMTYHKAKVLICSDKNTRWSVISRHAYNGDFRRNGDYKKAPKQDNSNNLYKGLQQLTAGVFSSQVIERIRSHSEAKAGPIRIFPIIISNAPIFLVEDNYENNAIEVNWAVYQCENVMLENEQKVKHAFIVNVEALGEFVKIFC